MAVFVLALAGTAFAAGHVAETATGTFVDGAAVAGLISTDAQPAYAFTEVSAATALNDAELASMDGTFPVVVLLPKVNALTAGVNVFGFTTGEESPYDAGAYKLYFRQDGGVVEYTASADIKAVADDYKYKYLKADGTDFTGKPTAADTVYLAVNVPAAGDYEPFLAVKQSGGSDSGGCDAGFSLAGLLSLGALFLLKKGK